MIATVTPDRSQPADTSLRPPFDTLVADGTITAAQAAAVLVALDQTESGPMPSQRLRPGLVARLAEIGAYLGAALVVAAGIVVVAQQWSQMTYGARVAVMAGTSLALLAGAGATLVVAHGRPWEAMANGDTLRRLSATLFVLAAVASFGTVLVAMLSGQAYVSEDETSLAFIVAGVVAFAVLVAGRWWSDAPLVELGLVAASVAVAAGAIQLWFTDESVAIQWTLLTLGLTWALVATFSHLVRFHTLVAALGGVVALFGASTVGEEPWSQRLALSTVLVVALVVYLVRPTWPYIAMATIAAVVLTVTWVGEAVGAAMALLAAGLVVLALAGLAMWLHGRRDVHGVRGGT